MTKNKLAIVIHGGASHPTQFLTENNKKYHEGLYEAADIGYQILQTGGSALAAVEKSVMYLEDNELFNAGRGSALNNKGEIEMDAAIMDGETLRAGAVSMVRNVKNPIHLSRIVMSRTDHVLLSGYGALDLAKAHEIILEPEDYFMTEYQYHNYLNINKDLSRRSVLNKKLYGTVGAVAVDNKGNVAAATSTGGITNKLAGRIGDSCIIGAGCYANNNTCAISGTGEGEKLIRGVIAHSVSMLIELKNYSLQQACDEVIKVRNKDADIGIIAVNPKGETAISFNTELIKCAWMTSDLKDIEAHILEQNK